MSEAFEFVAPLPPREISQNGSQSSHYWHNKGVQEFREMVRNVARVAAGRPGVPHYEHARLSLTFVVRNRIRRDILNYAGAFKPGIDALVDVGMLKDDSFEYLQIGRLEMRVVEPGEEPGVIVRVESIEGK